MVHAMHPNQKKRTYSYYQRHKYIDHLKAGGAAE